MHWIGELKMPYKSDFPIFKSHPELVYLDNAATSQKPEIVIDGLANYYRTSNGSPHRGAHKLSVESTELYNEGRQKVQKFINASRSEEIIFTRNATEAINLITYSYGHMAKGNIVLSITNHHSNILPFQNMDVELRYLYCDENGYIPKEELEKIDSETWMVSIPMISNGIGRKHDVKRIFDKADQVGAIKLLDAAQALGHDYVDVKALNPDLMVFSGHKMFAPQGIGVLYGKYDLLDKFKPFLSGGDMIEYVTEQSSTFQDLPERLEAGTQNVEGVYGLTLAIDYIEQIGLKKIIEFEHEITDYAYMKLKALDFIDVYGNHERGALISFNVKGIHPHDVASILDYHHIAIRAGHHCCQPLMHYMKTHATCRVSFSIFNSKDDIHQLIKGLEAVKAVFNG